MHLHTEPFQAYVQQLTGLVPGWQPWTGGPLPGYLEQRYEPRLATLAGQVWLIAFLRQPDAPAPLQLLKQLEQLAARLDPPPAGVCLVAEHLPPYVRNRLVELGQSFVVPGRQLFWAALGSAETVQRPRRLRPKPVEKLGPVAQQLLIALLLKRLLPPITITAAAKALGCTPASVSQAVKALEACGLVHSQMEGRERAFALAHAGDVAWQRAQPLLRTPIRQRVRIRHADLLPGIELRAGENALAVATGLAEPAEPVYAVASRRWGKYPDAPLQIPAPEAGTCVIELWRYPPDATAAQNCVDPLSLYLSLYDARDERLQLALHELMEQVEW
jgi:DNA-binding MarR family transcriptional regulator